jgi:hypothetical protein
VLVDRVNVGGNESASSRLRSATAMCGLNSRWSVDGVEITDVGAIGTPSYYGFGAFEELQVTTGSAEASDRTGGVSVNMVMPAPTSGAPRPYLKDEDGWQVGLQRLERLTAAGPWNSSNGQEPFKAGNRIVSVEDWGGAGGPIVRTSSDLPHGKQDEPADRFGLLGQDGARDLERRSTGGRPEQLGDGLLPRTTKPRSAATLADRPQPTTGTKQPGSGRISSRSSAGGRPSPSSRTPTFGSNFFLTGMYAESDGGFHLAQGGFVPGRT